MRHDQITLTVTNVDWIDEEVDPKLPTLSIAYSGAKSTLLERIHGTDGRSTPADRTDVTVRLHDRPEEADSSGVVSITDRVTGEYMIEASVAAEQVLTFVTAARRYGEQTDDTARYRILVAHEDDGPILDHEKRTLLVYAHDGELLRSHSLIPSGVEI